MDDKYLKIVERLEDLSRNGLGAEVRKQMQNLVVVKVPRQYRLPLANLARRNNLPLMSIRLLNPIVRSERELDLPASNQELAEYASSLLYIGAGKEAEELLSSLDPSHIPRVLLYRSFSCFGRWEYDRAIPLLTEYIQREPDPYLNTVGEINLAAAKVFLGHDDVEILLKDLRRKTQDREYWLLHGNSLELSALMTLSNRQYRDTKKFLNQAAVVLEKSQSLNDLFVRKWRAILGLHQAPDSKDAAKQVQKIKAEGAKYQNWETVRDCEFHLAVETRNQGLFGRVYFGTPYPAYRQTMKDKIPKQWKISDEYLLSSTTEAAPHLVLDLKLGTEKSGRFELKPGQLLHRALVLLIEDFYHPKRVGTLHSELFPDSYFNPVSSPNRIYQVVSRLRQWADESKVPLSIKEDNGYYWAMVRAGLGVLIREEKTLASEVSPNQTLVDRLYAEGAEDFSARQACECLGLSRSSFNRFAKWAIDEGILEKRGQSSSTHYRLLKSAA
ncbi:MAG: hypothetical protein KDD43_11660 [Bdellovibrionales bacterium]|nr:hypothetical protein [Bdellovibrionales bacterium]